MTSKILISSDVCEDEVVRYLAARYRCKPADIITRFLEQERIVTHQRDGEHSTTLLEDNEVEILRDMHISPTEIEFV